MRKALGVSSGRGIAFAILCIVVVFALFGMYTLIRLVF